jgi:hypothetical protein
MIFIATGAYVQFNGVREAIENPVKKLFCKVEFFYQKLLQDKFFSSTKMSFFFQKEHKKLPCKKFFI